MKTIGKILYNIYGVFILAILCVGYGIIPTIPIVKVLDLFFDIDVSPVWIVIIICMDVGFGIYFFYLADKWKKTDQRLSRQYFAKDKKDSDPE